MNDDLIDPNADGADPSGTAPAVDPVKAAQDDAWLAQFRADNAEKVMEYDYQQATESQAAQVRDEAERDYDTRMADQLTGEAARVRKDEDEDLRQATAIPARRDEYTEKAQAAHHYAEGADAAAARLRQGATQADARAKQDAADVTEHYDQFKKDRDDYDTLQESAAAAQRIATNEATVQHPGDASNGSSDKH